MENCFFIAAKVKDIQQNVKKCFSICKHLQKDNVGGSIRAVLPPFCSPFCLLSKKKIKKDAAKLQAIFLNIKTTGSILLSMIAVQMSHYTFSQIAISCTFASSQTTP